MIERLFYPTQIAPKEFDGSNKNKQGGFEFKTAGHHSMSTFWQTTLYQAAGSFNHFYERMLADCEEGPKETMGIGLANEQEQYMSTICVSMRFSDFVLVLAPGFLSCLPKAAIGFITLVI